MKFEGLMLLSVLLIAIMTLGAVSASDNVTEDIIPTDDGDVQYEEIPHSLEGDDFPPEIEMTFNYGQNEVVEDEPVYFTTTINRGKMTVSIDGKEKTSEYLGGDEVDSGYHVSTKGLPLGEHILNVNIVNDSYFDDVSRNFTFFIKNVVVDVPNPIIIDDYGDYLTVSVGSKDPGNLTVAIDDKIYTYNDISSTRERISLINLSTSVNPHIINITFTTAKGMIYNKTFIINSSYFDLWDRVFEYTYGAYPFQIPNAMDVDKVKVKIDGNQYNFTKKNSLYYEVKVYNLELGDHSIVVSYDGDDKFAPASSSAKISVYPKIVFSSNSMTVGQKVKVSVSNIFSAADNLTVYVDGKLYDSKVISQGKANIDITGLNVGSHYVRADLTGKYNYTYTKRINVRVAFQVPKTVTNGKGSVDMALPYDDPNGKFVVDIYNSKDKYTYSVKLKNGKASVPLSKINAGKYTVFPRYFDGKNWAKSGTWQMTVKNTKLTASDLSKYYGSSTGFKVKVVDYKGKVVKSKYVKFYINGKFVKKVKTTSKGYATLKIAKAPGSYKISAKYGDVQITRKLTVKHAVTLKTAAVKKSAKSLTLKATLKVGKKALKYKKVTFKFNGKTYKAKTNKYGIAKVTIKKTVLKKLKVGKTVKYQATYLKDTVKKSAKVKK